MQNVLTLIALSMVLTLNLQAKEDRFSSSISLVGMSMDYREYDKNGQILDSEKSSIIDLVGIDMGMKFLMYETSSSHTKLETNLVILGGRTEYVGSLLSVPPAPEQPYGSYIGSTVNNIIDFDYIYS